jgi:TolB-like protein/Flp pilus assembly protein TadD
MTGQCFVFGRFVVDMERGVVLRDGQPVAVGHKGLLLLCALLRSPGEVVDKASLMEAAWPGTAVEESNLSVQIAALRKQLGPADDGGEWITTVPRTGYRFAGGVLAGSASTAGDGWRFRPSIAVLPFGIMSDEGDKDYLADGITDDIITALTRYRWFKVAARNSTFAYKGKPADAREIAAALGVRYLLEGSVRHASHQVRIFAQLVDASSGAHVWAERYDLDPADVFAIQDEIAERVVGAIEPELLRTESRLAATRHTGNMTAWDLVRQGTWHFHKVVSEGHHKARKLFRQARAVEPDLAEAHIWLARVSAGIVGYGWSEAPTADITEGLQAATQAIYLDPQDPYAHYALAITSVYADAPRQAVLAAEKALELVPTFALGHLVLALARLCDGRAADAIDALDHGLLLNPHDPQNFVWCNLLAIAQLIEGRPDDALVSCKKALAVRPTWRPTLETLACCNVALGRPEEAEHCIARSQQLERPAADIFAPLRRLNPTWDEQLNGLLERAGTGV